MIMLTGPGTTCSLRMGQGQTMEAEVTIWRRQDTTAQPKENGGNETKRRKAKKAVHLIRLEMGPAYFGAAASMYLTGQGNPCVSPAWEGEAACKMMFRPQIRRNGNGEKGEQREDMARLLIENVQGEENWRSICYLNLYDLMRIREWAKKKMPAIDIFGAFVVAHDGDELRVRVGGGANVPLQALRGEAANHLGRWATGAKIKRFARNQLSFFENDNGMAVVVGGMKTLPQPVELHRLMLHLEGGANAAQ